MDDPTLLALLEKYLEGTLDDASRAELEKRIVSSVEARRIFWEYLEQHAFIGELSSEAKGRALARLEKPPTRRSRPSPPSSSSPMPFMLTAGLLIGFLVLLFASMGPSDSEEVRSLAAFRAKQAERRKAAEARLREIEQERQRLLARPIAPEGTLEPRKEEERKKALQELDERKRKVDEEFRQAIEPEKPAVIVEKTPEPPKPVVAPERTTLVAAPPVARIQKVDGTVFVDLKPVTAEQDLAAGQRVETGSGTAELLYADGTRVTLASGTATRNFKAQGGKRFSLESGSILAVVAKQPKGQPMVIETPTGEATVVGTTLRLKVDAGTRLDVEEGVVALKSKLNGKSVTVESGHYAIAAAGTELKSTPLPIDEVLVNLGQPKFTGGEWRLTKEGLESVPIHRPFIDSSQMASFVTLTFEADANRDYHVWVRGTCLGNGERDLQDGLILKFARAQTVQPKIDKGWDFLVGTDSVGMAGWGRHAGSRWIGGDGDYFQDGKFRVDPAKGTGRPGDEMPATVRFAKSGLQAVRIYLAEGPMRVEAVWLSTTQKSRPDAAQLGPVKK